MLNNKIIKNIDVNLFSGSHDYLRIELGLYYHITESVYVEGQIIELNPAAGEHLDGATSYQTIHGLKAYETNHSEKLNYIQINNSLNTTSSANLLVKSRKFPVRIIGNESAITTDAEWKSVVLGGTYSTSTYNRIYEDAVFNNYSYDYSLPYSMLEAKKIAASSAVISSYTNFKHYEIGYRYNLYLPDYEKKIANADTKMLPNVYMLTAVDGSEDPVEYFPQYIRNFVFIEGEFSFGHVGHGAYYPLFGNTSHEFPPEHTSYSMIPDPDTPGTMLYQDKSEILRGYLTDAFDVDKYSVDTSQKIKQNTETLYYDSEFIATWFNEIDENDPTSPINKFPFYAKIEFPVKAPTDHREESRVILGIPYTETIQTYTGVIKDNNLEDEFLMSLKYLYAGNLTRELNYIREETRFAAVTETEPSYEDLLTTSAAINDKSAGVDFFKSLQRMYDQSVNSLSDLGLIMGPKTLDNISAENPDSKYRYTKVIKIIKAIEDTADLLGNQNIMSEGDGLENLQELIIYLQQNKQPNETIAYRLKKVGGTPATAGQGRKINTIQNMYFMNTTELKVYNDNLLYYDTQVKHGEEYHYTLYAYVIVPGYEYKYSDLRLTRKIGNVSTLSEDEPGKLTTDIENHCLEFYDPNNNLAAEQLLETNSNLLGTNYVAINTAAAKATFDKAIDDGLTFAELNPAEYGTTIYTYAEFADAFFGGDSMIGDKNLEDYFDDFGGSESAKEMEYNYLYEMFATNRVVAPNADGEMITIAIAGPNRFATNAQIKSQYPYLADFNFHYMPTAMITEVPVAFSALRILDNPPVAADITPYQRKDNSQTIGFYINVESFRFPTNTTDPDSKSEVGKYPTPLNSQELSLSEVYKLSNNMLDEELVLRNSVSKITTLEVFRLDNKPESISDFDGNIVFRKDLSMKHDTKYKYTNCFYEERVATNKKYYYLFRFVNEQGIPGYLAPIQVAELIDDGGYKYSKFDVIYESDLGTTESQQERLSFKKIIELSPTVSHTEFLATDLDYSQPAATQLSKVYENIGSAQDLIWGKTFKFRLTSKKTGKKIDLNIKYNLKES